MSDIDVVSIVEPAIEILTSVDPAIEVVTEGVQGPAGPAGKDAQDYTVTAQSPISGHRVVMFDRVTGALAYASCKVASDSTRALGISSNAAGIGGSVVIRTTGEMSEPSWAWSPDLPIFLGADGVLTQVEPSAASGDQFSLVVGIALTPTRIFVRLGAPLFLA